MLGVITFMNFIQRAQAYNYDFANPVDGSTYFSTTVNNTSSQYMIIGLSKNMQGTPIPSAADSTLISMLRKTDIIPPKNDNFFAGYFSDAIAGKCDVTNTQLLLRMFGDAANKTLEAGFNTTMNEFCKQMTDKDNARLDLFMVIFIGIIVCAFLVACIVITYIFQCASNGTTGERDPLLNNDTTAAAASGNLEAGEPNTIIDQVDKEKEHNDEKSGGFQSFSKRN